MFHHVACAIAQAVDAVSQSRMIVQCPQPAPESWLKWLLPTVVQTVVSLLSIGAGVSIAVWSFRRNRQSEHEQWVRDQKRAEWRDVLKVTAEMESTIPAVSGIQERYDSVSKCLPPMVARLLSARGGCVFISEVLDQQDLVELFDSFVRSCAGAAESLQGFNAQTETDPAVRQSCRTTYDEIREAYLRFCSRLKSEARKSLITPSS